MSIIVTHHTRQILAESMSTVSEHQNEIAAAMGASLAMDMTSRPRAEANQSAALLVDLVISQAHCLVNHGKCLGLDFEQSLLMTEKVGASEFAPFGDKLADVLPLVVPACRHDSVRSAWCDAFWGIVLSMPRPARSAGRDRFQGAGDMLVSPS